MISPAPLESCPSCGPSPDLARLVRLVQTNAKERTAEAALVLAAACEQLMAELTRREAMDHDRYHLTAVVESANVAVSSTDLKGIIRSWNPGAERLYGHRAEEIVGKSIVLLMPVG